MIIQEQAEARVKAKVEMIKGKLIHTTKNKVSRKFILDNKGHCHCHTIIKYKHDYQENLLHKNNLGNTL